MGRFQLPYYTSRDYSVLAMVMFPFLLFINTFIFGKQYFSGWDIFLSATLITAIVGAISFTTCGFVAVTMKERFPEDHQLLKRLSIMIIVFLVLTVMFLSLLFWGFDAIDFFGYTFNEAGFTWAIISSGILNIFITFLMEAISKFESWKTSLKETEQLYMTYKQGQLMALKSQVNPHFLFNSLNTLSSLISDDPEEAEKFLDEISKVYRYMLRNDDEQLVPLSSELAFIQSYYMLLKARYGVGIELTININEERREMLVPPLSLQVIVENALHQNVISKSSPLTISISSEDDTSIIIKNNVQPKVVTVSLDYEAGLDNLVNKYLLLNKQTLVIQESETERRICLPLISKSEEGTA